MIMKGKSILILEQNLLLNMGLTRILEKKYTVYTGIDKSEGIFDLANNYKPDAIIISDLSESNIIDIEKIKKDFSHNISILYFTPKIIDLDIYKALRAGISGCILQNINSVEIEHAIQVILNGEYYFSDSIITFLIKEYINFIKGDYFDFYKNIPFHVLTKREYDILQMLAKGKSNLEISYALNVSEKTIKNHISHIFSKLSVKNRTQAVLVAIKNKWVYI